MQPIDSTTVVRRALTDALKASAHWYTATGEPEHDADLRVARKKGLFPSVTTIMKVWPKPMLDVYKIEQAILAAHTCPRLQDESDEQWVRRVASDAEEHGKRAAQLGSDLHDCLRIHALTGAWPTDQRYDKWKPWEDCIKDFFNTHVREVESAETAYVNIDDGYAGTVDLFGTNNDGFPTVWDYKTREWEEGGWPKPYAEYQMQLVAYRNFFIQHPKVHLMTVMVNRIRPEIQTWDWAPETHDDAWLDFLACREVWMRHKKYDPRGVSHAKAK